MIEDTIDKSLLVKVIGGVQNTNIFDQESEVAEYNIIKLLNGKEIARIELTIFQSSFKNKEFKNLEVDYLNATDNNNETIHLWNPKLIFNYMSGRRYNDLNGAVLYYYSNIFNFTGKKPNSFFCDVNLDDILQFNKIYDQYNNNPYSVFNDIIGNLCLISAKLDILNNSIKDITPSLRNAKINSILKNK